ncbi:MAG: hypothetical protein M1530_00435 [Candidatus Marsarchaeota archaeon]|nr:hypothetical protein [Candidatus Marsarchaeota archaeon]
MAKLGFVFSLDAMLAVLVLMAFASAFFLLSAKMQKDSYQPLVMLKQADDALAVLDKGGMLAGRNASIVNDSMKQMMPQRIGWSMSVQYYNYTGRFAPVQNYSLGTGGGGANETASASRVFFAYVNSTDRYYGLARLQLWAR